MKAGQTLATAEHLVNAPLIYKGKVREMYDLGEHYMFVVTDRISAFDFVLSPEIPGKGKVLNKLSEFWFKQTEHIIPNHMVHTDVDRVSGAVNDAAALQDRLMVTKKAERIDMECIVRGYVTGGGWRQYVKTGEVNGIRLPANLRKNQKLEQPIFTPSIKKDAGHDEDIPVSRMAELIGESLTETLQKISIELYEFARGVCERKGIILADSKFEFGFVDGELVLIDEIFTPDSSRFWAKEDYALDIDIDSMDKEPVRNYLAHSDWDRQRAPEPLPEKVVAETSARYEKIFHLLTDTKEEQTL